VLGFTLTNEGIEQTPHLYDSDINPYRFEQRANHDPAMALREAED